MIAGKPVSEPPKDGCRSRPGRIDRPSEIRALHTNRPRQEGERDEGKIRTSNGRGSDVAPTGLAARSRALMFDTGARITHGLNLTGQYLSRGWADRPR
jgi:hypothetical protein